MISDPIAIEDIDDVFDVVLPYLKLLEHKAGGEPWREILDLLEYGTYTLHVVGQEGFCILDWDDDQCHVVSAAAWTGHTNDIADIISNTAIYAKQYHCSKLTFTSPRPGWKKVAQRIGAHRVGEEYEVTL